MTGVVPAELPPSLAANPRLATWLEFADDTVVLHAGKVEIGQGIITALAAIAAHELDVEPARVRVVAASTDTSPDESYTAGSQSVQGSGAALRQVCAEVRGACLAAAAAELGVAPDEVTLVDGRFGAGAGHVTYWDLPTAELLDRDAEGTAAPKAAVTEDGGPRPAGAAPVGARDRRRLPGVADHRASGHQRARDGGRAAPHPASMVVGRASDLGTHVGNEIGISGCAALEQADVLGFAELPRDRHWIHTDPTRVRTRPASTGSSPMGSSYSR